MKIIPFIILLLSVVACAQFPNVDSLLPDTSSDPTIIQDELDADSSNETSGNGGTAQIPEPEPLPRPEYIVLNEILYDIPGGDTDGQLFVELYGTPETSLTDYQIRFVNGADGKVTEVIDLPEESWIDTEGFYVIADGRTGALNETNVEHYDLIDNFDPQNGPDGVQLLDELGELVDSVVYGTGSLDLSEDGLILGEGAPALDVSEGNSLSRMDPTQDTDDNATDFIENLNPSPGTVDAIEAEPGL